MRINEAAAASGVTPKMIRYYESIGLLSPPPRQTKAYRDFGPSEVRELRFIRRARSLGFSVDEIRRLLALWRDKSRPSREVKEIAEHHIADLAGRIGELQAMVESLRELADACHGDSRAECPILANLAANAAPESS
jgi:Cu(I)-responsive transcriptional regulator